MYINIIILYIYIYYNYVYIYIIIYIYNLIICIYIYIIIVYIIYNYIIIYILGTTTTSHSPVRKSSFRNNPNLNSAPANHDALHGCQEEIPPGQFTVPRPSNVGNPENWIDMDVGQNGRPRGPQM